MPGRFVGAKRKSRRRGSWNTLGFRYSDEQGTKRWQHQLMIAKHGLICDTSIHFFEDRGYTNGIILNELINGRRK
jgi:hypothetical protein